MARPLPIITDVYRVQLFWTGAGGTTGSNVLHVRKTASSASAVATIIDANVTANMWAHTTSGCLVTHINVTPLDGTSATFTLTTTGAKWTGTQVGEVVPALAQLISLRTANRGKRARGRLYLPFVAEGSNQNGLESASTVALLVTAWGNFLTALATASAPLVVASYVSATALNVASIIVETALATQRRRQSRLR